MQLVVFHFFYSYRLERAQADVQCDLDNFKPAGTYSSEDFGREVQAGGRRGYRSASLGVDGLVAIPVCCTVFTVAPAVNVGRKGDVSNAFDSGKKIGDWGESDAPLPKTAAFRNFRFQCGWRAGWSVKVEFFSDPDLPAGPYQALPLIRMLRQLARQQNFDPNEWECLVRPGRKIGIGEKLYFDGPSGSPPALEAEVT